jgi:tripartite-type tricarboxylate transporter receptor subunit TctC
VFLPLLVATAMACVAAFVPGRAAASDICAHKSVRLLVGFPPGGTTDLLARVLSLHLSAALEQQFYVDNRPGATGNIAAELASKARPDGCTYLVVAAAFASNVHLTSRPGYDPLHFTPVTRLAVVQNVLVVHPSVPVHTARELLRFIRRRPGEVVFANAGVGSISHLAVELLKMRVGPLNVLQVPYKGVGPAVLDLVSGEVDALFSTTPPAVPHIWSGRLRALAVASAKRALALPQVPTFAEAGYPGFEAPAWNGIVAPAGTPYDSVVRLNLAVAKVLNAPEVRERLMLVGAEPLVDAPDEFRAYLRTEVEKWARVVKASGIRAE